ncbi:MAG: phosphate/phosphite/phosphonate ABC transporter substrate-binding protein [Gammaproteobacteria bacterium]|nr:phosphate/phosphite/phosphonate ABC transporter substrate-binding protein [Gammaproteobacteria bacterium]
MINKFYRVRRSYNALSRPLLMLALLAATTMATAAELTFAIHPVLPQQRTLQVYQPLADYLTLATGQQIRLITSSNFLAHWQMMKRDNYDLILDGPHFTAYRAKRMGYTVLAKLPDVVSYTLVANEEQMILEPVELIGKTIATTPSPALGALRLIEIYPNPLRQPVIVETPDSEQAAELAVEGKVVAAMIPAPLVGRYPSLTTVATTEQLPSPAISASPAVDLELQQALRRALLDAPNNPDGRKALEALNAPLLEAADNQRFQGLEQLLEGMWGY